MRRVLYEIHLINDKLEKLVRQGFYIKQIMRGESKTMERQKERVRGRQFLVRNEI